MFLPKCVKRGINYIGLVVLVAMSINFGGCSAAGKLTDADGKPVPLYFDTAQGRFGFTPAPAPTPTPPPIAVASTLEK